MEEKKALKLAEESYFDVPRNKSTIKVCGNNFKQLSFEVSGLL